MWLNMSQMLFARRLYCDFLPIFIKRCDRCGSSSNLELISTQEVKIDSYGIHDKLLLTPDELPNIYCLESSTSCSKSVHFVAILLIFLGGYLQSST